ncbi:MAG: lipoprotein insertase outer membrane protein LolB [Burkholderiales bacterium]|nr:lipoprotein insertase outer membrane protein LolB [Burkholderiales bacterium]
MLAATTAAALAAGCAAVPRVPPPAEGFEMSGRVAVRHGAESASARMAWRHAPAYDELLITSPLGQGIAELTRRDGVYSLQTADGRRLSAPDPEALTERALGWRLPLAGLPDWVRGRPQAGHAAETRYGDDRRATRVRQLGWTIEYLAYDDATGLPSRLRLTREDLDIRLAIDRWVRAP